MIAGKRMQQNNRRPLACHSIEKLRAIRVVIHTLSVKISAHQPQSSDDVIAKERAARKRGTCLCSPSYKPWSAFAGFSAKVEIAEPRQNGRAQWLSRSDKQR
jgi:hypothetical protein